MNTTIQNKNSLIIKDGKVFLNNKEIVFPKKLGGNIKNTMIGDKIYINGYELKDGKFKRTLTALYHYLT